MSDEWDWLAKRRVPNISLTTSYCGLRSGILVFIELFGLISASAWCRSLDIESTKHGLYPC